MKTYFIYILECADGYLYTGFTNNIERRLNEHERGLNKECYTFKRRPVKLIFHHSFNDVHQAIAFEKRIKKWSGKKKLALANNEFDLLQIFSECRNATHFKYKPDD